MNMGRDGDPGDQTWEESLLRIKELGMINNHSFSKKSKTLLF